jgi:predicted RNA-binding Zn-ribbon protein involved in translation (DUF1610 family)
MSSWGEQFSVGDQGDNRATFHSSGMSKCPSCGSTEIKEEKHVAGCRHNGDGYGTEVYTCQKCSWTTSFQYDEAGDSYYYEMNYGKYRQEPPPPPPHMDLNADLVRKYLKIRRIGIPDGGIELNLKQEGCDPDDIKRFFEIANSSDVEAAILKAFPTTN